MFKARICEMEEIMEAIESQLSCMLQVPGARRHNEACG